MSSPKQGTLELQILKGRNISLDSDIECSVTVGLITKQFPLSQSATLIDLTGDSDMVMTDTDYSEDDSEDGDFIKWNNMLVLLIDLVSAYVFLRVLKVGEEEVEIGSAWIPLAGLRLGNKQKSWWPVGEGEVQVSMLAVDFDKPIQILDSSSDYGLNVSGHIGNAPSISLSDSGSIQNVSSPKQQHAPHSPVFIPHRREVAKYDDRFRTLEETHLIQYQSSQIQREYPHIARGSFGVVFKGTVDSKPNVTVVIKDLEIQNQNTLPEWQKELQVMAKNRSPYIAEVFGYSMQQNILTIVMEFMDKGSLYDFLHKKHYPVSLVQRMRMARHCALGLSVLHSNNIIHRDIKSMNILVNSNLACKITDFGTAKFVSSSAQIMNTVNSGTPLWMAPEVKMGQYSFSADIYSLGLVLYEIFENKLPFFDQTYQCVIIQPNFESASLVMPCLDTTPQRRPKANEVVIALDSTIRNIANTAMSNLSDTDKTLFDLTNTDPTVVENTLAEVYRFLLKKDPAEADHIVGVTPPNPNPPPMQQQPQQMPPSYQYAPQYQPQMQMQMQFSPQYQPQMQYNQGGYNMPPYY